MYSRCDGEIEEKWRGRERRKQKRVSREYQMIVTDNASGGRTVRRQI